MSEIEDRRQRARQAGHDAAPRSALYGSWIASTMIDAAVETATRVQITHESLLAFLEAPDSDDDDLTAPLRAFLIALGFEVTG